MSLLNVEPTGLQALAKHCGTWSSHVAVTAAPSVPAASAQATAATVGAIHLTAGATGGVLGTRMADNSGHLSTTAAFFSTQDAQDASVFAELPLGA